MARDTLQSTFCEMILIGTSVDSFGQATLSTFEEIHSGQNGLALE